MSMNNTERNAPLFKSLSDDALRHEYVGWRNLAYDNANAVALGLAPKGLAARSMAKIMRYVEIIEGVASQRKISLTFPKQ